MTQSKLSERPFHMFGSASQAGWPRAPALCRGSGCPRNTPFPSFCAPPAAARRRKERSRGSLFPKRGPPAPRLASWSSERTLVPKRCFVSWPSAFTGQSKLDRLTGFTAILRNLEPSLRNHGDEMREGLRLLEKNHPESGG